MQTNKGKILFLGLLVAFASGALDQWSKAEMISFFSHPPFAKKLTSFFNLVLVLNEGVSFGLFSSYGPTILIAAAALISSILIYWLYRSDKIYQAFALGFILGGAIGNIIDRVRFGGVVDFLDFHLYGYHWPAFNVADIAITIGVGLLLLELFLERKNG